jgi:hypothetical protein
MWLPGWGYSVSLHEYTKMLLVTGVMHGLVASAVLWRTVKRFDRLAGRAAQDQAAVPPAGIEGSESGIVHR